MELGIELGNSRKWWGHYHPFEHHHLLIPGIIQRLYFLSLIRNLFKFELKGNLVAKKGRKFLVLFNWRVQLIKGKWPPVNVTSLSLNIERDTLNNEFYFPFPREHHHHNLRNLLVPKEKAFISGWPQFRRLSKSYVTVSVTLTVGDSSISAPSTPRLSLPRDMVMETDETLMTLKLWNCNLNFSDSYFPQITNTNTPRKNNGPLRG